MLAVLWPFGSLRGSPTSAARKLAPLKQCAPFLRCRLHCSTTKQAREYYCLGGDPIIRQKPKPDKHLAGSSSGQYSGEQFHSLSTIPRTGRVFLVTGGTGDPSLWKSGRFSFQPNRRNSTQVV